MSRTILDVVGSGYAGSDKGFRPTDNYDATRTICRIVSLIIVVVVVRLLQYLYDLYIRVYSTCSTRITRRSVVVRLLMEKRRRVRASKSFAFYSSEFSFSPVASRIVTRV